LFERPYVDESRYQAAFLKPDALALAREAAARSCVLLKNDRGTLPLWKGEKIIALIGPFADDAGSMLGCWAARGRAADSVSLAAGLRAKLSPDAKLTVLRGCDATAGGNVVHQLDGTRVPGEPTASATNQADILKVASAARDADEVILALGEPNSWSGENSSRSTLDLSRQQMELFDAVAATGTPVIVVLFNGRPLAFSRIQEKAAAILEVWNPGVQGGNGVADVLFGDVDPMGRLTVSFPRSVGQVPVYYNHYNTGRPDMGGYVDGPRDPLYPFGFGLTYTTFEYGKVTLSASTMKPAGTITAAARIRNTGLRTGTEVVQLYLRDLAASAGPRPVRELKGFQRVRLTPRESRDVEFTITSEQLGYYDTAGRWRVEPGRFQLWIAKDSASGEPAEFELVP